MICLYFKSQSKQEVGLQSGDDSSNCVDSQMKHPQVSSSLRQDRSIVVAISLWSQLRRLLLLLLCFLLRATRLVGAGRSSEFLSF
jgi:hypothetical protein